MERYTDNPSRRADDKFEEQRLSQESENTIKHSSSSSSSMSPDESQAFLRRKVTDLEDDPELAGFRRKIKLRERIGQKCHDILTQLRRRRVLVSIVSICGLLIIGLIIFLAIFLSRRHVTWHDPEYVGREDYCTTWPVNKTSNGTFEFDQRSSYQKPWANLDPVPYSSKTVIGGFSKPVDFRIVGVVFYGRREYVDILDCYLERNLARNGGFLDEIRFLARTEDEKDLDYLDELVARKGNYSRVEVNESCRSEYGVYDCMWEDLTETNTLYIKIDDDVVWIDDDAIPNMVRTRVENTEAYAIGSNLVNSHLMAWPQYHSGAVYPFLPEMNHTERKIPLSWRNSDLPMYNGTISNLTGTGFNPREEFARPPYPGHRWLRVANTSEILHTPMYAVENDNLGVVVDVWALGAQQHMSLFQNIEDKTMSKYWVGTNGIWHPQYRRYNLNFAAIWSSDIQKTLPFDHDDEQYVTVTAPVRLSRPFLVADHSLVAHFHFGPQTVGMRQTDILDRYRAYANEFICPASSKRMPFFDRCEDF